MEVRRSAASKGETIRGRKRGREGARIPSRLLVSSDCFASIRWWCLYGYRVSPARSLIPRRNTKQMKRRVPSFVLLTTLPRLYPPTDRSISLRYVSGGSFDTTCAIWGRETACTHTHICEIERARARARIGVLRHTNCLHRREHSLSTRSDEFDDLPPFRSRATSDPKRS